MREKNEELNEEDHLNWEWRLVGIRGERKLVKMKKFQHRIEKENRHFRPGQHRHQTSRSTNPNLMHLGKKKQEKETNRRGSFQEEEEQGRRGGRDRVRNGNRGTGGDRSQPQIQRSREARDQQLTILYMNAQSIVGKINELELGFPFFWNKISILEME